MILYTANLQHGQKTDGTFDFATQVAAVADADIVCVQERSTSETGWDASLASAGLTQAVFHQHLGAGDGPAIWISPTVTVVQTYFVDLDPTGGSPILGWDGVDIRRCAVAIKTQVNGRQFYVVGVHLVSASGEDNSNTNFAAQRVTQISSLISWMNLTLTGGLPRIVAGDMNLPPNYPRDPELNFTVDTATNVITTSSAHNWSNDTAVVLRNSGGALPAPLQMGDALYGSHAPVYYARDVTLSTLMLALTPGGAAIDLTSNGTGTHFIVATQWDLFHAGHYDLWQEGLINGKATVNWGDRDGGGTPDMPLDFQLTRTHDTRRIDYIFLDKAVGGFSLENITLPDLRATCPHGLISGQCTPEVTELTGTPEDAGVRPSDHNFVRAELNFSESSHPRTRFIAISM